jgi:hypothetical protein
MPTSFVASVAMQRQCLRKNHVLVRLTLSLRFHYNYSWYRGADIAASVHESEREDSGRCLPGSLRCDGLDKPRTRIGVRENSFRVDGNSTQEENGGFQ